MELKLIRDDLTDDSTTGKLYVNGSFWCYTLEDKTRDHKVYGETCIPLGTYPIYLWFWPKHQKWYPRLRNVPEFEGILIHKGTNKNDTLGCILVGMDRGKDLIFNCQQAYDPLVGTIEEVLKVEEVFIEVTQAEDAIDERTSTTSP
jgi:hypothetical protein